ncbi:MAG: sterol desaturase family protein [Ideonella sp.]|nr:sterol desaturase family protein [Ideonella sp.]MCC7459637.1 sterol desaturase family protein [Nitrospira sp.]
MPTPFDLLMDPMTQAMLALFAGLALWEFAFPARALPVLPGWHRRALASFALYFLLSSYLPLLWADALAPLRLVDLSRWPLWAAAALGLVAYEFAAYAWHRAMHRSDRLWRLFHQLHHSAERLDVVSAFWFSPFDMVAWTLLPGLVLTLLGLSPQAATLTILAITFLSMFQHANVRTPRWIGLLVQRPEMHSVHHARDVHHFNYADLPIVDLIFGTFRNPCCHVSANGFWHGASGRVVDMLLLRDVSRQGGSR